MDHPYYTVTVTNLTRGWAYSAVEGDEWNPADDVILVSPLNYSWGFIDGVVPGQLDVFTSVVNIAARTASDVPNCQLGDAITIDVRIGTTGSRIIAPPPMRVTAAEVNHKTKGEYTAILSIGMSDLSVDWRGQQPGLVYKIAAGLAQYGRARGYWRERMAEIGNRIGYSIGCPTGWADNEGPDIGNSGLHIDKIYTILQVFEGSAEDNLLPLLNSHQPAGDVHSWATIYAPAGHPSGYQYVGPTSWAPEGGDTAPIAQPASAVRIEAVPASRRMPVGNLPLVFSTVGGVVTLIPSTPSASGPVAQFGLSAAWCSLPVKSRRAREGAINWARVLTKQYINNNGTLELNDAVKETVDAADVVARGPSIREVQTQLLDATPGSAEIRPESGYVGANFLNDTSALNAPWSYDSFTLRASLIPQTQAAVVLPVIAPRLPGETNGDGRLMRAFVLYDLDSDVRYAGEPVTGFITGGSLTISGGDMTFQLATTPGLPIRYGVGSTPTPVTVGDVQSGGYGTTTVPNVDPLITLADLDYVDA